MDESEWFDKIVVVIPVTTILAKMGAVLLLLPFSKIHISNIWMSFWQTPADQGLWLVICVLLLVFAFRKNNLFSSLDYLVIPLTVFLIAIVTGGGIENILSITLSNMVGKNATQFGAADFLWIIQSLMLVGFSWLLTKLERGYRTFSWYKAKRSSANSGFVFASFCIGIGLIGNIGEVFHPSIDIFFFGLALLVGFMLLYVRSGRTLWH